MDKKYVLDSKLNAVELHIKKVLSSIELRKVIRQLPLTSTWNPGIIYSSSTVRLKIT